MALCPFHQEDTPSFNLWAPDEEGVPTRWGCFGCRENGDVVDLIARLKDVSMEDALRIAAEMAEKEAGERGSYERKRAPKREPARDHGATYDKILEEFGQTESDVLAAWMRDKGLGGEELISYAMTEWGWTCGADKWIAMPHRNPDGKITGIKYRKGAHNRRNEVPSTFPALYGCWRDRGRRRVVLCEGETDTLWAAWQLRDVEDVDVLGLPSGASQRVEPAWLEQVGTYTPPGGTRREPREVILVFDSDVPGMLAAMKWCGARTGVLLARLPEGEDLLSCGIPSTELLENAREPRLPSGLVTVEDGVFARTTKDGSVPLADFAFQPVRELDTDEGPAWEGFVSGDRRLALLRTPDLHSAAPFIRWANRHGVAWTGGSGPAVQGVYSLMKAKSAFMPLERASTKAGKIGRSFVGPGFCIGADRIRYIPPVLGDAKLETRLRIVEDEWDPRAINALENVNEPAVMAILLGWTCATLLRGQRAPAPPLFVSGESGAGKTNLLATMFGALGFNTETNLTTTTPFGVDCMVSSCIGLPVWFDEYRGGARVDSMQRLRQLLRDAYYGQPSLKGGMKSQATELSEVTTWSGIVVSGEMSSGETSHRDRIVMLDLDPNERQRQPFAWLQDQRRTSGMGYALLDFLAHRSDLLFQIKSVDDEELPDRFREQLGFVTAGWEAWKHFRHTMGLRDTPTEPDLSRLVVARKIADDPWLEAIKACEGVTTREGQMIVEQTEEGVVLLAGEVIVEARRVGIELPARANELISWLKRRYPVKDMRRGLGRRAKLVVGMKL